MPLTEGSGKEAISANIAKLRSEKYPEKQAIAIAYANARGDMDDAKFGELKKLLDEFFTEESHEPEHKKDRLDAACAKLDSVVKHDSTRSASLDRVLGALDKVLGRRVRKDAETKKGFENLRTLGEEGIYKVGSTDPKVGDYVDYYDRNGEKQYGKVTKFTGSSITVGGHTMKVRR